jgi:hypothetical protein
MPCNNPGTTVDLGVGLWAWPLPMDFDGDGDLDLVVVCPDKPYNGAYFFENPTAKGEKNARPVFKPGRRISGATQNVQLSAVNGEPKVLSPGVAYPDFKATGLAKGVKIEGVKPNVHTNGVRANEWRYVDYDGDGAQDLIIGVGDWKAYGWDNAYTSEGVWTNGPLHGYVYFVRNSGSTEKPRYGEPVKVLADGKPVDVFGCPSPNFGDWDGDGDLDLLCGEFLDGFTYFENIGTRAQPVYAAGRRLTCADGTKLSMDLEMITPTAIDWDGDGDLDLICGDEDGRVAFIENTGKLDARHVPVFRAPRYFRQEADELKFGALATPFGCDWDGDGDWDLICGDSAGYIAFIENISGKGVEYPKWAEPRRLEADGKTIRIMAGPNGSIQGPAEAKWGYTTQSVADWDGDGLPDIVANSIFGDVVWYRNTGTRSAPKLAAAQPIEVEWAVEQPRLAWGWRKPQGKALLTQWRTTPVTVDWNKDGLVDLVMLDQEGYLAFFERAMRDGRRVLLPPKRVFCDEKGKALQFSKNTAGRSGRRKICVVDWDGDGRLDLLINSKNAEFWRQVGEKDDHFLFKRMGGLHAKNIEGHDVSPTTVDFDGNGIPDYIGGAEDGHFYYLRNPRVAEAAEDARAAANGGAPVAQWTFDEPAGATSFRPSAGTCTIEATNGLACGAVGVADKALSFTKKSSGLICGSEQLMPMTHDFAVFLWMKSAVADKRQRHLFSNNAGQSGRCELGVSYSAATAGKLFWWHNNDIALVSRTPVSDGRWHHVGVTRTGSRIRLYVDGLLEAEGVCDTPLDQSVAWRVGADAMGMGSFFAGWMDDLRIYRRTFETADVTALFKSRGGVR